MKPRIAQSVLAAATLLLHLPTTAAAPQDPGQIKVATYNRWEGSLHLVAEDPNILAVCVPATGGRLQVFGFTGDNLLFDPPASNGKTLANTGPNLLIGGYQLDFRTPAKPGQPHPDSTLAPATWKKTGESSVLLTNPIHPESNLQLEKELVLDVEGGELGVTQIVRNTGSREVQTAAWDQTQLIPGGFLIIPLGKNSRFPAKWSMETTTGRNGFDGVTPQDPRARVMDGFLIVQASGNGFRFGTDSDAGWVAYAKGQTLLVKYFPVVPGGKYGLRGHTIEGYVDQSHASIEPLSPETSLLPGQQLSFPEKWTVVRLKDAVTEFKEARKAAKKVPSFLIPPTAVTVR